MRAFTSLALALVLALAAPAVAEICAPDTVPAATLLMPYFELDVARLGLNNGPDAQITLRNAGAAPVLARVVLWTDMAVPTYGMNVYLTGYDVHRISLGELFQDGIDGLVEAHWGVESALLGGQCGGFPHGDRIVRGFVTVDNVNSETELFPTDDGYFGPGGVAVDDNVLVGEYLLKGPRARTLEARPLVAIEASADDSRVSTAGSYTFYGRYVGWDGSDHREPLPSQWNVPYRSPNRRTNTTAVVWRDSGVPTAPFGCASPEDSGWYPLALERDTIFFDEAENPTAADPPLPLVAQSLWLFRRGFRPPADAGWVFLDFDAGAGPTQAFVEVSQGLDKRRLRGRFPAFPMNDLCEIPAPE